MSVGFGGITETLLSQIALTFEAPQIGIKIHLRCSLRGFWKSGGLPKQYLSRNICVTLTLCFVVVLSYEISHKYMFPLVIVVLF